MRRLMRSSVHPESADHPSAWRGRKPEISAGLPTPNPPAGHPKPAARAGRGMPALFELRVVTESLLPWPLFVKSASQGAEPGQHSPQLKESTQGSSVPTYPQRAGRYIPATIRGSRMDEYDPAPPDDDEIAEAYRLKYQDE